MGAAITVKKVNEVSGNSDYAENWRGFPETAAYTDKEIKIDSKTDTITSKEFMATGKNYGSTVTVTAPMLDGYFFNGFVLVTDSPRADKFEEEATKNIIPVSKIKTDDPVAADRLKTLNTYSYIPNVSVVSVVREGKTYYFYTASFVLQGDTKIIALYEAQTYLITVMLYKYDNEKEGGDVNSRLTTDQVTSGKINGNMIAEKDTTATLTAVSYNFAQFYGWTAGDENTTNTTAFFNGGSLYKEPTKETIGGVEKEVERVPIDIDVFEDKVDADDAQNNGYDRKLMTGGKLQLRDYTGDTDDDRTNALLPLFDPTATDGRQNLSRYTNNNIYIPKISGNLTLFAYYGVMEYTITINIADVLTGYCYAYGTNDENAGPDTYICYSDEYIEANGGASFENPTSKMKNLLVQVDPSDTFIYTIVDENGKEIKTSDGKYIATKITSRMVYTGENNPSVLKIKTNKTNGSTPVITYISEDGTTKEYINYLEASGEGGAKIAPYKEQKANYVLSNPYNILDFSTSEENPTLKSDLFQITIKDINKPTTYYSKNANSENAPGLKMTYENNMLSFTYKVFADGAYGFPTVTITPTKGQIIPGLEFLSLETTYKFASDKKLLKNASTPSLNGFYNDLRLNYDPDSEGKEDSALDTLDFSIDILYEYIAKELTAKITYSVPEDYVEIFKNTGFYKSEVILTGPSQTPSTDREKTLSLQYQKAKKKGKYELSDYVNDMDEFKIYIIKNAGMYITMLNAIQECNTLDKEIRKQANDYLSTLNYFKPTASQLSSGYVLSGSEVQTWHKFINTYYKQTTTYQKDENKITLSTKDTHAMRFEMIDILSLYTNGTSYRMLQNCYYDDDTIVYNVKMNSSLVQEQSHETRGWLTNALWWADPAYYYMNKVELGFGRTEINDGLNWGSTTDVSEEDFDALAEQNTKTLKNSQKTWRTIGLVTRFQDDKYKDLWTSDLFAYITPTYLSKSDSIKSIEIEVKIDKDINNRIITANKEYDETPIGKAALQFLIDWNPLMAIKSGVQKWYLKDWEPIAW